MGSTLVNILYNRSEVKRQIWAVVIWYTECVEETDFGQFIVIKLVKWDREPTVILLDSQGQNEVEKMTWGLL